MPDWNTTIQQMIEKGNSVDTNNKEFGRLVPNEVATKLPPNHDVTAAWLAFKTTSTDEYFLAASLARNGASVEGVLFDMFLRGWVAAGGKVG